MLKKPQKNRVSSSSGYKGIERPVLVKIRCYVGASGAHPWKGVVAISSRLDKQFDSCHDVGFICQSNKPCWQQIFFNLVHLILSSSIFIPIFNKLSLLCK
jgi:hypothetical protein